MNNEIEAQMLASLHQHMIAYKVVDPKECPELRDKTGVREVKSLEMLTLSHWHIG